MWFILLGIVVWVICSILAYGRMFAYLESVFPTFPIEKNRATAATLSIFGPISLIITLAESRHYRCGFKYTDGCKWVKYE